jgi:hypothetical protein
MPDMIRAARLTHYKDVARSVGIVPGENAEKRWLAGARAE